MLSESLTDEQIARQDDVDNKIFELICDLVPRKEFHPSWDIEMIGGVRDAIQDWVVKKQWCTEYEFYPWVTETVEMPESTNRP